MVKLQCVVLKRKNVNVPWGFRIAGGINLGRPIIINKVTGETLASQQLSVGDIVLALQGIHTSQLTHEKAVYIIQNAKLILEITVNKVPSNLLKTNKAKNHQFNAPISDIIEYNKK